MVSIRKSGGFIYGTAFLLNACVMIIELIAGRIVSGYLGQSLYTWTTIIGVVLAGISIGNALGGRLADRLDADRLIGILLGVAAVSGLFILPVNRLVGDWVWMQSNPMLLRIALHIALVFLPQGVVMGLAGPVIAKKAVDCNVKTGAAIGAVYSWGAAGSIFGTFLSGYWLQGWLGSPTVVLAVCALLGLLSALHAWGRTPQAALLLTLLALWIVRGGGAVSVALGYRDDVSVAGVERLYEREGSYARVRVETIPGIEGGRNLFVNGVLHSQAYLPDAGKMIGAYICMQRGVADWALGRQAADGAREHTRTLILGGGGFVLPRYLQEAYPQNRLVIAEIEPVVIQAAEQTCGFQAGVHTRVYAQDGGVVVANELRHASGRYDLIIGDTVENNIIPYHLATDSFARRVQALLKPDGVYLVHVIDYWEEPVWVAAMVRTLRTVFPEVRVLPSGRHFSKADNTMIICSSVPLDGEQLVAAVKRASPYYGHQWATDGQLERLAACDSGIVLTDEFAPVDRLTAHIALRNRARQTDHWLERMEGALEAQDFEQAARALAHAERLQPHRLEVLEMGVLLYTRMGSADQARDYAARAEAAMEPVPAEVARVAACWARTGSGADAVRVRQAFALP